MANYLLNSRTLIFRQFIKFNTVFQRNMAVKQEDIKRASITPKTENPFDLFNEWFAEASKKLIYPLPVSFVLSSLISEGPGTKITSRVMKFLKYEDDTFIFMGSDKTQKFQDIKKFPRISMCFVWTYPKDDYFVYRQVRVQALCKKLSKECADEIFNILPLPLKVESLISKQNEPIEKWEESQDEFIKNMSKYKKNCIKKPSYMICCSANANEIQFFHTIMKTEPPFMADRILFTKEKCCQWKCMRIGA